MKNIHKINSKMATYTKESIILFILVISMSLIHAHEQVPCFFIFGDSLYDNGNNNNLLTLAKANYLPYGFDFFFGPTGRFTNGLNIADYLARLAGLTLVPPYALGGGSNAVLRGLNYASGAGGILDLTSVQVGDKYPMNRQLNFHQSSVNQIATLLGNQTAANGLLRQCLYTVSMGTNDMINNYFYLPVTPTRLLFTPERFANELIQHYSQQLTTLYNLQARKVAILGLAPLGCIPQSRALFPVDATTGCAEVINDAVKIFNTKLITLIGNLNANLPGAQFTYLNFYKYLSGDFATPLGIKVPSSPCCDVFRLTGLCLQNGGMCSNRDEYTYFDNFHPTQIVCNYVASRSFVSQSADDAIPVDVQTLIQQ